MSIEQIEPLCELKGHQAPVLTVEYSGASFLGEHILASGSGKKISTGFTSNVRLTSINACRGQYVSFMGSQITPSNQGNQELARTCKVF